ncbi:probable M28 family peptidase [Streptomyces sp. NBRC 110611]|nr:probable M28 family peptidase [Streptomyces sp. NBRC 110611]
MCVAAAVGAAVLTLGAPAPPPARAPGAPAPVPAPAARSLADELAHAVTGRGAWRHLAAIEAATTANGGHRVTGSAGYDASADYLTKVLTAAGYQVERQRFTFPDFEVTAESGVLKAPEVRTLHPVMANFSRSTPEGGVTAQLVVPSGEDTGCAAADYAGADVTGKIVLVRKGKCFLTDKQRLAADAGAAALLMNVDLPQTGLNLRHRMNPPSAARIPTATVTRAEAEQLLADMPAAGPVTLTLDLRGRATTNRAYNVLADTPTGRAGNTVVMGAHLDSVDTTPGANDNAAAAAMLLETAVQLAPRRDRVENRVRFAWWAAEEKGLSGSRYYVDELTGQQRDETALYLNLEMIGSPNFARQVYNGRTLDGPAPDGSEQISRALNGYFATRGLPTVGLALDHRSDHDPFIAAGIPAGGVNAGADTVKTPEWAELFGGTAGQMLDPCYHQRCDTPANVNRTIFGQFGRSMAWALGRYAVDTSEVNGRR